MTLSQYTQFDLQTLVDMLVARIKEYDRMLSTRVFREEEFAQCKQILAELHTAIKERAEQEGYSMDNIYPSFPDNNPTKKTST